MWELLPNLPPIGPINYWKQLGPMGLGKGLTEVVADQCSLNQIPWDSVIVKPKGPERRHSTKDMVSSNGDMYPPSYGACAGEICGYGRRIICANSRSASSALGENLDSQRFRCGYSPERDMRWRFMPVRNKEMWEEHAHKNATARDRLAGSGPSKIIHQSCKEHKREKTPEAGIVSKTGKAMTRDCDAPMPYQTAHGLRAGFPAVVLFEERSGTQALGIHRQ
ncbi:hypothetical protein C8R44DRAFT_752730 [Mycena epipterygia]|nr:hypothetical protein C8R44DRAFT_752730 [Mycena epipterygia]